MNTPEEIEAIALSRFEEARILFRAGKFDGAYFLSGYSVELILKAKIARKIGVPNLFSRNENELHTFSGIQEIRKALKTHNLFALLLLSGLKIQYDIDKASNKYLSLAGSLLFQDWFQELRYRPVGFIDFKRCKKLIELLEHEIGILQWIYKS